MRKIFFFVGFFLAFGLVFLGLRFIWIEIFPPVKVNLTLEKTPSANPEATQKKSYPAFNFSLNDIKGNKATLSDFKGKIIILNFWASWDKKSTDFLDVLEELKKQNLPLVEVLAIDNLEDPKTVNAFLERGNLSIPILLDKDGSVGDKYKIGILPVSFFIDKNGLVQESYIGVLSKQELIAKIEKLY